MSAHNDNQDWPDMGTGTIEDQAEAWLIYLYSGTASTAGEAHFRNWLHADPAHTQVYARAERLWRGLSVAIAGLEAEDAPAASRPKRPDRRHFLTSGAVAAGLAVLCLGSWWNFSGPETNLQFESRPGEIKTVYFPDGTAATLGGDTVVTGDFSSHHRKIELVSGGAYFDVKPNAHPLDLTVGTVGITVKGTEFDVRRNPRDVRLSVVNGRVDVGKAKRNWLTQFFDSSRRGRTTLGAGDQVIAGENGELGPVSHFDPKAVLAWREGRLVYTGDRLVDVLAEINRYRSHPIRLAEPALGDLKLTLVIPVKNTDQLLTALEAAEGFTVTRSGAEVLLSRHGR